MENLTFLRNKVKAMTGSKFEQPLEKVIIIIVRLTDIMERKKLQTVWSFKQQFLQFSLPVFDNLENDLP